MSQVLFEIVQGDSYMLEFKFTDVNGDPEDATGQVVQVMGKANINADDDDADVDVSVTGSGQDALDGSIFVPLTHDDTADVPAGIVTFQYRVMIPGTPNDYDTVSIDQVVVKQKVIKT